MDHFCFVRHWKTICFELSERNAPDVTCPWSFWLHFARADFDPSEGAQPAQSWISTEEISKDEELWKMDEDGVVFIRIISIMYCGHLWTFPLKFSLSKLAGPPQVYPKSVWVSDRVDRQGDHMPKIIPLAFTAEHLVARSFPFAIR